MTRILVVESEMPSRQTMRNILQEAGYDVDVAIDGDDAVLAHDRQPADLVIADVITMEAHPSFAHASFGRALVLAMPCGLSARDADVRVKAVHADGMLPKPFRRDQLLAAVRNTLECATCL